MTEERKLDQYEVDSLTNYKDNEALLSDSNGFKQPKRLKSLFTPLSLLVHGALITFYTVTCLVVVLRNQPEIPVLFTSPISNLTFQTKPTMSITAGASPYAGGPDPEIDLAWHNLLGNTSIRVSSEELKRNGNHQDSVALPNNEGHMVWLGVFHQLHCIKQLRQLNYRDAYHPNMTTKEALDLEVHINHCLEMLRQAVMCNPETTLTTFTWSHSQTKPVLDVRRFERKCVDWEAFMDSVTPRVIHKEEVDDLVNPLYNASLASNTTS